MALQGDDDDEGNYARHPDGRVVGGILDGGLRKRYDWNDAAFQAWSMNVGNMPLGTPPPPGYGDTGDRVPTGRE